MNRRYPQSVSQNLTNDVNNIVLIRPAYCVRSRNEFYEYDMVLDSSYFAIIAVDISGGKHIVLLKIL